VGPLGLLPPPGSAEYACAAGEVAAGQRVVAGGETAAGRRLRSFAYAISDARRTWLGTFVTGISRDGDGVSGLLPSPPPSDPPHGRPAARRAGCVSQTATETAVAPDIALLRRSPPTPIHAQLAARDPYRSWLLTTTSTATVVAATIPLALQALRSRTRRYPGGGVTQPHIGIVSVRLLSPRPPSTTRVPSLQPLATRLGEPQPTPARPQSRWLVECAQIPPGAPEQPPCTWAPSLTVKRNSRSPPQGDLGVGPAHSNRQRFGGVRERGKSDSAAVKRA
jgi:hypothetical protein